MVKVPDDRATDSIDSIGMEKREEVHQVKCLSGNRGSQKEYAWKTMQGLCVERIGQSLV